MPGSEKSRCLFRGARQGTFGGVSKPILIAGRDNFRDNHADNRHRVTQCAVVILRFLAAVRWPRGRRRRFAKAAGNHRTGLKSMISGPFFIGSLVGVGSRMIFLGPRLGTLVGTPEPTPTCAYRAHVVLQLVAGELLRLGRREEREAQGGLRHRARGDRLPHRAWRPARHPGKHPNPDRYAGQHIFVVQREQDVYLVPFVEDEHSLGVPEDDHPEPEGDAGLPR